MEFRHISSRRTVIFNIPARHLILLWLFLLETQHEQFFYRIVATVVRNLC